MTNNSVALQLRAFSNIFCAFWLGITFTLAPSFTNAQIAKSDIIVASNEVFAQTDFLSATNAARQQAGVPALQLNEQLEQAALQKALDMQAKHYFAHFYNGVTPWSYIEQQGYNYTYAGENLARGFKTTRGITEAWLASPAHRHNLLSDHYQEVGYATVWTQDDLGSPLLLTVQMFGSR